MLSGNMLSQLIPFIIAPILTRLFVEEEFATFANYLAIASLIGIVASGRLEIAIPIAHKKKDALNVVYTALVITFSLVILSILIPMNSDSIGLLYNDDYLGEYLITVPLAILSIGLLGLTYNWVLRLKKYRLLSLGKVSQSIVNSSLAAILGYAGWGVNGLIFGWLISQFVGIIVMLLFIEIKVKNEGFNNNVIKSTLKEFRDFPLINSLHAFTDILATQVLLFWVITSYFGLFELGLFVVMNKYIRAPIVLITSSVSSIFYAETSEALNNNKSPIPILKKTVLTTFLFSIPFIAVILFFAPQVFGWYLGDKWAISGSYAQRIIPILFMLFLLSPISSIPILFKQQQKAFIFSMSGYAFSLGSLFFASYSGMAFIDALTVYAVSFSLYQFSYLYWFYLLIKNRNADTG